MVDQPAGNAADTTGIDTYLQLFIEFMQLLSIFRLTRIGVVWRSAAEAVLVAMSITPISSYSWVSIECALREGLSPQQYVLASTLASTYIPGGCALCYLPATVFTLVVSHVSHLGSCCDKHVCAQLQCMYCNWHARHNVVSDLLCLL
jgi:hypothetical protein